MHAHVLRRTICSRMRSRTGARGENGVRQTCDLAALSARCIGFGSGRDACARRPERRAAACPGERHRLPCPSGFDGDHGLQRAHQPDRRALRRRRARVRRREERADQGLRQPLGHDADASSPTCGRTSTTSGIAACSGWRCDPNFPTTPYVYVLYTYDAGDRRHRSALGHCAGRPRTAARRRPGATADGCVVSGRLSRLQAAGNVMTGTEQVLVEDWCQQYPSHSVGTVEFGPDGALYASAGDGASFNFADYGQDGSPLNPCGDPPGGVGATLTPPTAEGGALRTQDLRTTRRPGLARRLDHPRRSRDRRRLCPTTRSSASTDRQRAPDHRVRTCAIRSASPSARARASSGSATSAGTSGRRSTASSNPTDCGGRELRLAVLRGQPAASRATTRANLTHLREPVRVARARTRSPSSRTTTADKVVPRRDRAPPGAPRSRGSRSSSRRTASNYPAEYQGALFFADYSRDCIWVMKKGGNPIPIPGHDRDLRRRRRQSGERRVRARRQPLLRRLRRRHDPQSRTRDTPPPTRAPT